MNDTALTRLLSSCHSLLLLNLAQTSITNRSLCMIADKFKDTLKSLNISYCTNITTNGVLEILQLFTKLSNFSVSGCNLEDMAIEAKRKKWKEETQIKQEKSTDKQNTEQTEKGKEKIKEEYEEEIEEWGTKKTLKIFNVDDTPISESTLRYFLSHLPGLKVIGVSFCPKLSSRVVTEAKKDFPSVQFFNP
eukprot:CAMPEP_0174277088 /NCGR_PEP_ID=MMETSP0439-20130205/60740_1 /TAXON_ID=0 /ORGANISM="Stereomyxa ramosa, Strain Chinc5" /LENGTH=190 /DNA_ID=CAMNT_0015369371 /DNA_START=741 /DNA_END=1313 /DNA_ORIENTATION=+